MQQSDSLADGYTGSSPVLFGKQPVHETIVPFALGGRPCFGSLG